MTKHISYILLLLTFTLSAVSQQNNDSILAQASKLAQAKNYAQAKEMVLRVVDNDSMRTDAVVMVANLDFWSGNNEGALTWIEKAKNKNAKDEDFYTAYMNILLVNKKYAELLLVTESAKTDGYKNEVNLLQKKMLAHQQLGKSNMEKVYESYKEIKDNSVKQNPAIQSILSETLKEIQKNTITANYSIDMFSNRSAQHLASIGTNTKSKINSFGLNINYANRFNQSDLQIETTNYLHINKLNYIYFNYGYGVNNNLFPKHRFGLEYYFPIAEKIETSLGGRYMNYINVIDNEVYIVTGHLGTYIGDGWIGLRPFWVIKKNMQSLSFSLKYRKYGESTRKYWGAELMVGNSPDDMYSISQSGFNDLTSYKIRLEKSWMLGPNSDLVFAPAYGYEEYALGPTTKFRSRFVLDFIYRFNF